MRGRTFMKARNVRRHPKARARLVHLTLVILALSQGACAGRDTRQTTPETAIAAFARHLGAGQFDEAYALLPPEYRQRKSRTAWKQALSENPQEVSELSDALRHGRRSAVTTADDVRVQPIEHDGGWFVDSDIADLYDQSTPRATLRTFIRAVERRRYDVLLRVVPDADKQSNTTGTVDALLRGDAREELERMLVGLRTYFDAPIETNGDRATMSYAGRLQLSFVREAGIWKIQDAQ